jgi:hypothetical protein
MALIMIGLGVVILLSNLGLLPPGLTSNNWVGVALFAILGGGFLAAFLGSPRGAWWAAIPSFTLLGLAFLVGDFWPASSSTSNWLGPAVFLGSIGLSFLLILLVRPDQWWAIFPAGALMTVAGVVITSGLLQGAPGAGFASGGVLFLGLALTFVLVFLRPVDGTRMTWALWPAGLLGLVGVLLMLGFSSFINYLWALALIVVGALLLLRGIRR